MSQAPDPFAAIPVVPKDARREPSESPGGLRLVRVQEPAGALSRFFAQRLNWKRERAFELDSLGARFYDQIDGSRSLGDIAQTLRKELNLEEAAVRRAIAEFTATLMRRGLVYLRVDAPGAKQHGS